MTLFDLLTGRNANTTDTSSVIDDAIYVKGLEDRIHELHDDMREAQEDLLALADAFDNRGWSPIDIGNNDAGIEMPLKTVKKLAKMSRGLVAGSPFVKRGVEARISYIWGRGVTFDNVDGNTKTNIVANRKKLFNPNSYAELERVLATDGNAFFAVPLDTAVEGTTAYRVVLDEIVGVSKNPDDREEIMYYKREYTITITTNNGEQRDKTVIKYYASLDYYNKLKKLGKSLPKRWRDAGVEQNFVLQHIAVNKQVGWTWGVPDVMPAVFWAKAYKEYLEDNANLVKAYSRIAWQVKASGQAGANAAAAQMMRPPVRDPLTGEAQVGGTAISTGTELSPVGATGSQVDFTKGEPLASAIAAALDVPTAVIVAGAGEDILDLTTIKAMEARQRLHTEHFLDLFEFWGSEISPVSITEVSEADTPFVDNVAKNINDKLNAKPATKTSSEPALVAVTWPQIASDSTKDRMTALGTAVEEGIIFKQEARKDAIEVLGIAPYKPWDELPTMADDPAAAEKLQIQQEQSAQNAENMEKTAIAKQGVSGGVAAKGGSQTSNNEARNNRAKDTNNK